MKNKVNMYQDTLNDNVKETLKTLTNLESVLQVNPSDKKIKASIETINKQVREGVENINKEITVLSDDLGWDTFNIALFGETNAGKSTIIEALTNGNGSTIGDGRKDFTQKSEGVKYNDEVLLIDLPGMEGHEEKYIKEIKKGINHAHIVFYIITDNKEPEAPTIEKIKNFLKDQTNVYSIINVRGTPNKHVISKGLNSENTKSIEKRSIEKFKNILGTHYKGNLIINANFAFLATHSNVEDKFKSNKDKLIKFFDSREDAIENSGITQVKNLISKLEDNGTNEIIISNTYKYIGLIEQITNDVLKSKKDFDEQLRNIKKEIEIAHKNTDKKIIDFENTVLKSVEMKLNKLKVEFHEIAKRKIKNSESESSLKTELDLAGKNMQKEIDKELKEHINILNNEVKRIYENLEKQIDFGFKYSHGNSYFFKDKVMGTIKFSIGNVIKEVVSLIVSFIMPSPIGIATGIAYTANRIFRYFKIDRKNHKNRIISETQANLTKQVDTIRANYNRELRLSIGKLKINFSKEQRAISSYISKLKSLSYTMTNQINTLMKRKIDISKNLVEFIEDKKYDYVYIDLNLDRIFIVGEKPLTNLQDFNLKNHIYYESFNHLISHYSNQIDEGYIYLAPYEEFQKRAISNLISIYRYKGMNIKGVRRK